MVAIGTTIGPPNWGGKMRYCLECKEWSKPVETKEDKGVTVSTTIKCSCGNVLFRYSKGK